MSTSPIITKLLAKAQRTDLPSFRPGDTVRVQVKIKEGEKERLQAFEGVVIKMRGGPQGSFTVRKMSFGQGVERIFPIHSKVLDKIDVLRSAKVRRAKLYYLRALRGKAARLKEVDTRRKGAAESRSMAEVGVRLQRSSNDRILRSGSVIAILTTRGTARNGILLSDPSASLDRRVPVEIRMRLTARGLLGASKKVAFPGLARAVTGACSYPESLPF